jgi:hypothetical protein
MQQFCSGVQPALQLGVAVSYATQMDGQESNCMELLALCTVLSYAAAHWTDLRSHQ